MVHDFRPLISIGYKYNKQKKITFIDTDNTGSTQAGIPYLSKYPDQFSNVSIHPVAHPLVMYKFFGFVNYIDSLKKLSQSDQVIQKFWAKQCGWLQLCTTASMGISQLNILPLFTGGYAYTLVYIEKLYK